MKKAFLIIFILSFNISNSQKSPKNLIQQEPTKEETENWIKSVINKYGHGMIKFEGSDVYYNINSYPITHDIYNQKASIKNLVVAKKGSGIKEGVVWIHIPCIRQKCVYVDCQIFDFDTSTLQITLNSNIPDDIKERLVKAFNHLIDLYNPNKILDTF